MSVKLNSLFDSEIKVYYVTQVFKQGINIKTICPNCVLKFRNTQSHLFQIYLGTWVKIEIVSENHVCKIICHFHFLFQALSKLSKYILVNAIDFFHL